MVAITSNNQLKQHFVKRLQALSRARRHERKDSVSLAKSARPSAQSIRKRTFRPPKFVATLRTASLRYLGKPLHSRRNRFNTTPPVSSSPRRRIIRVSKLNFAPPEDITSDGVSTLRIRHPFEDFAGNTSHSESLNTPASSQVVRGDRQSCTSYSPSDLGPTAQNPLAKEADAQPATPAERSFGEIMATKASVYSLGSWAEIDPHIDTLWVSTSVLDGLEEELAASEDWSLGPGPVLAILPEDIDVKQGEGRHSISFNDSFIRMAVSGLEL